MYFAKINSDNIVEQVIAADQDFINLQQGNWISTDINGINPINYAGIGFKWNASGNAFISPQPYPSWTLDTNFQWQPPTPKPTNTPLRYYWDESSLTWISES